MPNKKRPYAFPSLEYSLALGGQIPDSEVDLTHFKGNKHTEGGLPINSETEVEDGETRFSDYVFSDQLMPEGGKKTFAELSKKIESKYKGRERDAAAKKSKKQELERLSQENERARLLKEATDQIELYQNAQADVKAYGGMIKYENGGFTINPNDRGIILKAAKKKGQGITEFSRELHKNRELLASGGFFNQAGKVLGDYGKLAGSTAASTVGGALGNPDMFEIDPEYSSKFAGDFENIEDVSTKIGGIAGQVGGQVALAAATGGTGNAAMGAASAKEGVSLGSKALGALGSTGMEMLPEMGSQLFNQVEQDNSKFALGGGVGDPPKASGIRFGETVTHDDYLSKLAGNVEGDGTTFYNGFISQINKSDNFKNNPVSQEEVNQLLKSQQQAQEAKATGATTFGSYDQRQVQVLQALKQRQQRAYGGALPEPPPGGPEDTFSIKGLDPDLASLLEAFGTTDRSSNFALDGQVEPNNSGPRASSYAPANNGRSEVFDFLEDSLQVNNSSGKADPLNVGAFESKSTIEDPISNFFHPRGGPEDETKAFGREEAGLAAAAIPALYNIGKGAKTAETEFERFKPEKVDLSNQRQSARRHADVSREIASQNMRNYASSSGDAISGLAAQNVGINENLIQSDLQSYMTEENQNAQIENQARQLNNQTSIQETIANEQNKAMSDSLVGLGLSDLSNSTQGYLRDKGLAKENVSQNQQQMDIINAIFPNYEWGTDPESDKMMIQFAKSKSNIKK